MNKKKIILLFEEFIAGAEPKVKPETKPIPKPGTRPGTKPSRPSTPFKPDIRPGIKPLAKIKERVNNLIITANKNPENKLYAAIVGFIAKSMGISPKQAAPIETSTPDAITEYLKKGLDSGDDQFNKIVSFYKK